ncbi:MAG: type 4a pilus biogenesis protein PilO [Acidobacteria bacterium]|nr:type 4a pilus biogenesis protein PilO [Acidobacteriota bacterium]MCB9396922.1 type 4a pilus biogenesis protein PilO [Acidobacteriota bacterium]
MKLNQVQQAIIGIVIVLVALLVGEFFVFQGKKETIQSTISRIEDLEVKIGEAERIKKHAAELEEEMNHLQAQLDRLKKILPVEINKPKFYQDIKRYANENQIEVVSLSNNKPVKSNVVMEHPFTFYMNGGYHDLGNFFAKISNYPRILNVKGLYVSRPAKDSPYSVEAQFLVSVYTYIEPTEAELKQQVEARKLEMKGDKSNKGGRK